MSQKSGFSKLKPVGWWDGDLDLVRPYLQSRNRFVLATGFNPETLPPFEVYVREGDTLREVVETGRYERLLSSFDIPAPPDPVLGRCSEREFCFVFQTPVKLSKIRFIDLDTGMVEKDASEVVVTGFFNGYAFLATDTNGCSYAGVFRQIVPSLYRVHGVEEGGRGVQVKECQDPDWIGNYKSFFISTQDTGMIRLFFSYSTLGSVFRPGYMLIGNGFD